ncbi:glycosyltransferase [Novosphingobium profundi]|uniref:glycosyltransferase n=1 Tax=Novosphingobium profundi TaxID=1774954 RepID=UPI001BD93E95|nr:glycosyltransferase [Novosphingobium profundi]MBT0668339.1 glycosyltransferase [Novosphingobium profundi]
MMRIGLLTTWASRLNGGVFEAVVQQAAAIRSMGATPVVFALEDEFSAQDCARFEGAEVYLAKVIGPRQIGFAPSMVRQLLAAELDVLHLHGIWTFPSRAGAVWARRTGRPYLISPHGMLDPWITARGRLKKRVARIGYEAGSWKSARRFHALTEREAQDIERETGRGQSVVIPNAGPVASETSLVGCGARFLYLGRIHPKKNIDALVDAWAALGRRAPDGPREQLKIAGWGEEAHVEALKAKLQALGDPSVQFVGPLFGEAKAQAYAEADYFVLPSHSEGLPMVVLEAWASGTPVLMTRECNLPEGFASGAALDCGFEAGDIATCLGKAAAMPIEARERMAASGLALARTRFSEEVVARQWAEAYGVPDRAPMAAEAVA